MPYVRFAAMILTSTVVMFILMYLNTYALEHVFFSETRVYMAILMGATMAAVMLAFMLGMYGNTRLNVGIFLGSVAVFGLALWLVRSQATVSGASYMRAMIPHHSIAIMTSERAQIRDPRVRKLADEIIEAQRREISEMQYLIAAISSGHQIDDVYRDPPATPGAVQDALSRVRISQLDLSPMAEAEADRVLQGNKRCTFERSRGSDPILWSDQDGGGGAAVKLNDVLIALNPAGDPRSGNAEFSAPGTRIKLRSLGGDADWRANAELVFHLDQGPTVGYRGFYGCRDK